jgi:hypothetical protein
MLSAYMVEPKTVQQPAATDDQQAERRRADGDEDEHRARQLAETYSYLLDVSAVVVLYAEDAGAVSLRSEATGASVPTARRRTAADKPSLQLFERRLTKARPSAQRGRADGGRVTPKQGSGSESELCALDAGKAL